MKSTLYILTAILCAAIAPQHAKAQDTASNQCAIDAVTHPYNDQVLVPEFYVYKPYDSRLTFFIDWNLGQINFKNGHAIKGVYLRYDRHEDELVWMRIADFKMGKVNKDQVESFILHDKNTEITYLFKNIPNLMLGRKSTYARVMAEGKLSFYVIYIMEIDHSTNDVSTSEKCVVIENGIPHTFSPLRSGFLRAMGTHKKEMRAILRKNDLPLTHHTANMAKAIELFNTAH